MDSEMGYRSLLATILPVGLLGLMLSSYFSAILSTADSCLMAASNILTDIIAKFSKKEPTKELRLSQIVTLAVGLFAILLASQMQNVLELMLYLRLYGINICSSDWCSFLKKSHPAVEYAFKKYTIILILNQKINYL
jgi:SSS family solute:Na+ symporter